MLCVWSILWGSTKATPLRFSKNPSENMSPLQRCSTRTLDLLQSSWLIPIEAWSSTFFAYLRNISGVTTDTMPHVLRNLFHSAVLNVLGGRSSECSMARNTSFVLSCTSEAHL